MRRRWARFKYLAFGYEEEFIDTECWPEVECPLPYENLPSGEYLIRGNKREHRTEYWKVSGKWYLVNRSEQDNGHRIVDQEKYDLIPHLSEREWDAMMAIPQKRLNAQWQLYVWGYRYARDLRKMIRDIHKDSYAFRYRTGKCEEPPE